jgi:hypothetical protein
MMRCVSGHSLPPKRVHSDAAPRSRDRGRTSKYQSENTKAQPKHSAAKPLMLMFGVNDEEEETPAILGRLGDA